MSKTTVSIYLIASLNTFLIHFGFYGQILQRLLKANEPTFGGGAQHAANNWPLCQFYKAILFDCQRRGAAWR